MDENQFRILIRTLEQMQRTLAHLVIAAEQQTAAIEQQTAVMARWRDNDFARAPL